MNKTSATGVLLLLVVAATSSAFGQGPTPPSAIRGTGAAGQIPVWLDANHQGNSVITQNSDGSLSLTATTAGSALFASNAATSGNNNGLFGVAASPNGNGVLGGNNATSGFAVGVTGFSFSPAGAGVNGTSGATSGGIGVIGSSATSGVGVIGQNQACSGAGSCTPVAGTGGLFITGGGGIAGSFIAGAGGAILVGSQGTPGSSTQVFRVDSTGKGFFDGGTQTGGADFAESVAVGKVPHPYEPGDLLVLDIKNNRQLTLSTEPYSMLVAGVYSTKPGVLATTRKTDAPPSQEVPLAIVGIVPCKVSAENGSIKRGDLLVTSSTPGYAMKGTDRSRMLGAIVGKAMEPLTDGIGTIEVLVTLQ